MNVNAGDDPATAEDFAFANSATCGVDPRPVCEAAGRTHAPAIASSPTGGELDENGEPIIDAVVVEDVSSLNRHRGRIVFSEAELTTIRGLLVELSGVPPSERRGIQARLRRVGFYVSDWSRPGDDFAADDLDKLVAADLIRVTPAV